MNLTLSGDGQFGDFVDRYLNPGSISGREVMCVCLFHEDSKPSMQFNLDSGLFVCFTCGVGGSYRKIEKKLGVNHKDIEVGLDVIYRKLNDLRKSANMPDGPRVLPETTLDQFDLFKEKWEDRKLKPATVDAFDLGYDMVANALTIPVRNMHGDLIGVTRRFLDPDADSKYRYPKGFHKAEHLFASWMVAADTSDKPVVLTEGAIDCMSVWEAGYPAMAIYGSSVSHAQIRILRALGITRLILFFDNDKAGRDIVQRCRGWKRPDGGKWERVVDLDLRRYFDVSEVSWYGIPRTVAKDANDLGILKRRSLLANARTLG